MDIVFRNQNGTEFRLKRLDNPAKEVGKTRKFPANRIESAFKNAKPVTPNTWAGIWREMQFIPGTPPNKTEDVIKSIQDNINKSIVLEAITPGHKISNGNSGGAKSAGQSKNQTMPLGEVSSQKDASEISPQSNQEAFSEKNATENDEPVKEGLNSDEAETSGEPISMVSGEEILQLTDYTLPGPIPFAWTRTYRSSRSNDIGLGCGWTHSGSEYLELSQEDSKVFYIDQEGRKIPFNLPREKQRSKYLPEQFTLDRTSEKTFVLKKQGEPDRVFTQQGTSSKLKLLQLRHAAYRANTKGLLSDSNDNGFAINFSYNNKGQLTSILGNWGKSFELKYTIDGKVSAVNLANKGNGSRKCVAEYSYDKNNDLISQRNAKGIGETYHYQNHLLVQRTLATGFRFYFKWDGNDKSAKCIQNWGDNGVYAYAFDWDPKNKRSKTTDSRGYTTEFNYDDYGHILEEIDNEGNRHTFNFDRGRKESYTDPEGNITEYFYDVENNPAGMRDPLGNSISIGYFNGNATAFTDKDQTHWKREYNDNGQIRALIDPYRQKTRYSYNDQGLISSITNPMGHCTKYRWSQNGELETLIDSLGHEKYFTYDSWGQIIRQVFIPKGEKQGVTTEFEYNTTGKLTKVIAPNGETTHYTYNENDQLIKYSDPNGRTTEYKYDGLSQVIERIDAEGQTLQYEYDTERNLTSLTNENGERYQFFYDGNERLIKEIGFDGRIQTYEYNKAGHLIRHTDADEVITEFERDALGQMLTKTSRSVNNNTEKEERIRYQYDAKGRLVETYNQHQYIAFEYNKFGNLVNEHHCDINAKNQRIKSSESNIQFSHIWPGLRSGITLPDRKHIRYDYNALNQLTRIALDGKSLTHIERNNFGQEIARHQGVLSTHTDYDPMGRIQKQRSFNQHNKTQGPIQREYSYDKFGNLNQLIEGDQSTTYIYDLLNRLEKVEGVHPEQFTFDPASNLLNHQGKNSHSGSVNGNRLTMQGDKKFTYDARGNLIQEKRGKDGKLETHFYYNLQNQLIKVEKGKQTTEYKYDPIGRRIEKRDNFGTTRYLWADDQLTQENRNNISKTYVYEPESFKPVAMMQDGEIFHYHLDHLGTPKELTNESGKVVWKARYKAYGNLALKEVEDVENNLRFQGQYFDEETGLHYNRHRYYNPSTGQFTTQDPIGLLGGVNNYHYAPNPISWVDPLGLKCKEQQRILKARERQHQMLEDNVGFNVSPTEWDAFPAIGRTGSFISDKQSVTNVIGNFDGISEMAITKLEAARLEKSFGLEPGSLQEGFKVRKVENIKTRRPRSPMEGNDYFLGPGNHLPGGAPEMVVDSIPTVDGCGVTTLVTIIVV